MNKKFLISLLAFAFLLCSSVCFATNAGTEAKDSLQKSETTLENMGNGIKNIAQDVGNGIQGAAGSVGNSVKNMTDGNHNNTTNNARTTTTTGTGTDGYTATRTNANAGGMTNTAWIWLILGIVGIVIVAMTWYYVSQDNSNKR